MEALYVRKSLPVVVSPLIVLKEFKKGISSTINPYDFRCHASDYFIKKFGDDEKLFNAVSKECDPKNLFPEVKRDSKKKTSLPARGPFPGTRREFVYHKLPEGPCKLKSVEAMLERKDITNEILQKSLQHPATHCFKESVVKESLLKCSKGDLVPYVDIMLTVRVYCPSPSQLPSFGANGKRGRFPKLSEEFLIPGKLTLNELKSAIRCVEDEHPFQGDCSHNIDEEAFQTYGDVCKSAFFYFGNDFYCAVGDNSTDYCRHIKLWAKSKGMLLGTHHDMSKTLFEDLTIRLGYPYLYMHQGSCEHIVIFTNARLIHPSDATVTNKYPMVLSHSTSRGKECISCNRTFAKFLIVGFEGFPYDRAFVCRHCLERYCYINENKVGNFKVFRYVDRIAIF